MQTFPRRAAALFAIGLLAGGAAAPAASLPVVESQLRTASGRGELVQGGLAVVDEQHEEAPDLAPFVAEPTATAASGGHLGAGDGYQDSRIELAGAALAVEAGGAALGFFDTEALPLGDSAAGEGESRFELVFSLSTPAAWSLVGVLAADLEYLRVLVPGGSASATPEASISLVGLASGEVFRRDVSDPLADFQPVQEDVIGSGLLAPDTYTLSFSSHSLAEGTGGAEGSGLAVYAVRFQLVPEPGTSLLVAAGLVGLARVVRRPRRLGLSRAAPCGPAAPRCAVRSRTSRGRRR